MKKLFISLLILSLPLIAEARKPETREQQQQRQMQLRQQQQRQMQLRQQQQRQQQRREQLNQNQEDDSSESLRSQPKRLIGFQPKEKSAELLLGQPTGFRYQQWTDFKRAYNFDLAYHTKDYLLTHANYVFYFFDAKDKVKRQDFWNSAYFYYGPGILFGKEQKGKKDFLFGLRGFVGLDYLFVNSNFAIRTEAAVVTYFSGEDSVGLQLFIGLAYRWDRERRAFYKRAR